jgi:hypothetical protein
LIGGKKKLDYQLAVYKETLFFIIGKETSIRKGMTVFLLNVIQSKG